MQSAEVVHRTNVTAASWLHAVNCRAVTLLESKCATHRLEGLEEAVEEYVPDDFAIFKGRNVPDEEVGENSQRG